MPFGFLTPWFLGGLALIGVPVLVHLTRRDRAQPVPFPSLMFVRRLPVAVSRRRRLRDIPLLLLRALALALLVAAFARPLLDRARAAVSHGPGGRELVVLLDRSYSMGVPGRWQRAQDAARQAVATLAPNDRGTVILFDAAAGVAAARTGDRNALRVAIDTAHVGAGVTHYAPALALASRILAQSPLARREALLVSDFQRAAWSDAPETHLPTGARLTWVDVGGSSPSDVGVAGIELAPDSTGNVERVRPVVRLVTNGVGGERAVRVTLAVGGRDVQTLTVRAAPRGATTATFNPVPVASGWTPAEIKLSPDSLPADDAYRFVLSRQSALRVLLVTGASTREDAGLYLRRALDVADAPRIQADVVTPATLSAGVIAGHALVVLHDAPLLGPAARAVAAHVRRGGGLLVALGENSAREAWDPALATLLPARIGEVADRSDAGGARLASIERAHPVFAPFGAPHSGDLAAARVLRYRTLTPERDAQIVARFDDGAPAIVERVEVPNDTRSPNDSAQAAGRVVLWASTLDAFWTDLPLQPVFVPLVHGLVAHAARFAPPPAAHVVGETIDPAQVVGPAAEYVADSPSGHHVRTSAPSLVTLNEAGFYRIRSAATNVDAALPVAANVDPAEADPARVDPATIEKAVGGGAVPNASAAAPETRAEREARQAIWWWLLATAALLLVVETLLSNRLRRTPRVGVAR